MGTNTPFQIGNVIYLSLPAHRNGNGQKSCWTISVSAEVDCFQHALSSNWLEEIEGWGLVLNDSQPQVLGRTNRGQATKIAKFVDKQASRTWHGYPADYQRNHQDRPPMSILMLWHRSGLIQKHQMAKLRRGQTCNL